MKLLLLILIIILVLFSLFLLILVIASNFFKGTKFEEKISTWFLKSRPMLGRVYEGLVSSVMRLSCFFGVHKKIPFESNPSRVRIKEGKVDFLNRCKYCNKKFDRF